jgi:hypothetical protein
MSQNPALIALKGLGALDAAAGKHPPRISYAYGIDDLPKGCTGWSPP